MLLDRRMISKSKAILRWIAVYRNWPTVLKINMIEGNGRVRIRTRAGVNVIVRQGTNDFGVFNAVYNYAVYTPQGFSVEPGFIIVDIGANIGSFALSVANILRQGNGRVYAFEPMSEDFEMLCANIRLNSYSDVIIPERQAVWESRGRIELFISEQRETNEFISWVNMGMHTTVNERKQTSRRVELVECVTLDVIIEKYNLPSIDLLKMDCEGAEYEILFGASSRAVGKVR